jgi:hypothetical protein
MEPKSLTTPPTFETVPSRDVSGWSELSAILHGDQSKRFITLVVGAGIHQVPKWTCPHSYSSAQALGSWERLLDAVLPSTAHSESPSLRWELGILDSDADDAAQKKESRHFAKLCATVTAAEAAVLALQDSYEPVQKVLSSSLADHVISLNFDLVAERLHCPDFDPTQNGHMGQPANGLLTHHYGVHGKRFWHPHGDRNTKDAGCLGIRRYAITQGKLEEARNNFKSREPKGNSDVGKPHDYKSMTPETWIDLLMTSHLIFLGTSLSFNEWDIWFALVNRWRNYAKPENKKYEPKTFVLTTGENHKHLPSQFLRLDAPRYEDGWKWLGDMLLHKSTDERR